jgi:hypothetical protein
LRDGPAIAAAVMEILEQPGKFTGDTERIAAQFSPARTAEAYEALFVEIQEDLVRP